MARISTYDRDLVLSRDDILIGSDAENTNVTRNFSVGSLIDFISLSSGGVVDTNFYLSAITANQTTGVGEWLVCKCCSSGSCQRKSGRTLHRPENYQAREDRSTHTR